MLTNVSLHEVSMLVRYVIEFLETASVRNSCNLLGAVSRLKEYSIAIRFNEI